MSDWIIVDDSPEETAVFAGELSRASILDVVTITAAEAHERLENSSLAPDGILMDVDLSNEAGMKFTGPGLAQNIRVAQRRKLLPSFPVVRFAARERVRESIGSDSSSDDVFDLKIEKDGLRERDKCKNVQRQLLGVSEVYGAVTEDFSIEDFFCLSTATWNEWGHEAVSEELSVADLPYLRAGKLTRTLVHPGILINEVLLAIRLGLDPMRSRQWKELCEILEKIKYQGVGHRNFSRWWARGLEEWWQSFGSERPLAGTSIAERISVLEEKTSLSLAPLEMPKGSLGNRPWRTCLLSWEMKGESVPVDPSRGVRVIPRDTLPSWMDPFVVALGPANRCREDDRLNKADLKRLTELYGND